MTDGAGEGFRPCVGIVLVNGAGLVFAGRRADADPGAPASWQMPQGGVDPGEDLVAAALRELREETGIAEARVAVEAVAPGPVRYEVPEAWRPPRWKGRWKGQAITWVRMRYLGTDAEVGVATEHPEFADWRWQEAGSLADGVVPFKREAYRAALALLSERA